MEKLIEVEQQEIVIDFHLSIKCRSDVHIRSLHPTTPVAFKVQTSSPQKFLVNPPSGMLPPLSSTSCQVILRPQSQLPSSFPRSTTDRFLIKAAVVISVPGQDLPDHPASVNQWFASRPHLRTHDTKLKVVYVGALLLRHAVDVGDAEALRHIVRRQKSLIAQLSPADSTSLLRTATSCHDPTVFELLMEAGLDPSKNDEYPHIPTGSAMTNIGSSSKAKEIVRSRNDLPTRGWTALHTAAAAGTYDTLVQLLDQIHEENAGKHHDLDGRDCDGRTPLHLATSKGYMRCVRALIESGADKNAKSKDGRTALYRAAANGDHEMVALLLEVGADPTIVSGRGRTPLDVARDRGNKEVVEMLERGEVVLTAARKGDLKLLESLLKKGVGIGSHDQYGMTALHSAAIKGHRDVVCLLVEFGMDLECRDVEGHTPLHLAVEGGWLEIVEVLVGMGTDVNARTNRGATPLYMAKSMGYEDISRLLVSKGASSSAVASSSSSMSST